MWRNGEIIVGGFQIRLLAMTVNMYDSCDVRASAHTLDWLLSGTYTTSELQYRLIVLEYN